MSRAKWKGPLIANLINHISRKSEITPNCFGLVFTVYNGKDKIEVLITEEMLGHKFGEFSFTRKKHFYKKKGNKK